MPTSRRCLNVVSIPQWTDLAAGRMSGDARGHGPKETERPDDGSHSCAAIGPDLAGRSTSLIRGIRGQVSDGNHPFEADLRKLLIATHRTSRDAHATLKPSADQAGFSLHEN